MERRPLALVFMLCATLLSFGLAVHTALQGRIPLIETGHALIFALFGLIIASNQKTQPVPTCQECGAADGWELGFCSGCGRIPRHREQQHPTASAT